MHRALKIIAVIAAFFVIGIAVMDLRESMPKQTTAPETEKMDGLFAACNKNLPSSNQPMPPSGSSINVSSTTRRFLHFPRAYYPENLVKAEEQNATIGKISNGEFANDPGSSCWTHYYEFDLASGSTEGIVTIIARSNDPALPDYMLTVHVLEHL